jgi:transposase
MAHSDAIVADALKDYAHNLNEPTKEIAARHGVSPSSLTVWARNAKIGLRGRGREKAKQPDARQREILEMCETLVYEDVAERFGMTKQRVSKIVKRWKDWKRPKQSPFMPDDVVSWDGKLYKVLEGGPLFGKAVDEKGNIIHNFYWSIHGKIAMKVNSDLFKNGHKIKLKKAPKKKRK